MPRRAIIAGLLFACGAIYLDHATKSEPVPIRRPLAELPVLMGDWIAFKSEDIDSKTKAVSGVDDYTNRSYRNSENAIAGLYIGYYRSQRQGDTIHSPLNCLPGAGWNPVKKEVVQISTNGIASPETNPPPTIQVNRIIVSKGSDRQVVIYWYQSHGRVVANEYLGKFYTVVDAFRTNRTDAALVRVMCPAVSEGAPALATAEKQALDFVQYLYPLLDQYLPN
jgi:EpsI family protein